MSGHKLIAIVTTIQPPTPAMLSLGEAMERFHGELLIVGDRKGPTAYAAPRARLYGLEEQRELPFRLSRLLPVDHYVRKNLGYLLAIAQGATCIFETDDDNSPLPGWRPRAPETEAIQIRTEGWFNVYQHFGESFLWPRGYPLEEIAASRDLGSASGPVTQGVFSPIQQGLADGNPDVDAIWRLVLSQDIRFANRESLALGRGVWCPFNSQSTWWWPQSFPLLYLPSHCTFRMTDIWRSFVAQRCIWEIEGSVCFHAPEVFQDRNAHNLLQDFQDEVPGYLQNAKICAGLGGLDLGKSRGDVPRNLRTCYEFLVGEGFLPHQELALVDAWLADLSAIVGTTPR